MKLQRLATGVASAALLFSATVPAFATGSTVEISGNGKGSDNTVKVYQNCSQEVTQSNGTYVGVNLNVSGNSGKNKANGNTGGTTTIDTGKVTNTVDVTVLGGSNTADVSNCCCGEEAQTDITIKNNGEYSDNYVKNKKTNSKVVEQKTKTKLWLTASVYGNSGKNKAKGNTGSGTEITTDNVENNASVFVEGGANQL